MNPTAFLGSETTSLPFHIKNSNQALSQFVSQRELGSFSAAFTESPHRLTVSMAPDGTRVGNKTSSLFDSFKALVSPVEMKQMIAKALQTWAVHSNINFGFVRDSGADFGATSDTNNAKIGDLRFAAIPMTKNAFGVAIDFRETTAGSWAGDIFLNSQIKYDSKDELFNVLVHEVGHALGLEHNEDLNSPMYEFVGAGTPAAKDISDLQGLFGTRALDINEYGNDHNDTLENATELENKKSLRGRIPIIGYGDIGAANDVDFFNVPIDFNYGGKIRFTVTSRHFSLLAPKLELFDEDGNRLAVKQSKTRVGDTISVAIEHRNSRDQIYVAVSASEFRKDHGIGSYAVSAEFLESSIVSHADMLRVAKQDNALLDADAVESKLRLEDRVEGNGEYSEIQIKNGFVRLKEVHDDDDELGLYRVKSGIASSMYTKVFEVKSTDALNSVGTFSVHNRSGRGFAPTLSVFLDKERTVQVAHRVVANEQGNLVVQIQDVKRNAEYYIEVKSAVKDLNGGRFTFEASFSKPAVESQTFTAGTLSKTANVRTRTLHIGELQFLDLTLTTSGTGVARNLLVWASIYDKDEKVIQRFASRMNDSNSRVLLMEPGSYRVEFTVAPPGGEDLIGKKIEFALSGRDVGDPTGPKTRDPTNAPIRKPTRNGRFVYPNGTLSTRRNVWVKGRKPTGKKPKWVSFRDWYWFG